MNDIRCKKCGSVRQKIPIKRLGSTLIIEYYCEECDESKTYYPDMEKLEKSQSMHA